MFREVGGQTPLPSSFHTPSSDPELQGLFLFPTVSLTPLSNFLSVFLTTSVLHYRDPQSLRILFRPVHSTTTKVEQSSRGLPNPANLPHKVTHYQGRLCQSSSVTGYRLPLWDPPAIGSLLEQPVPPTHLCGIVFERLLPESSHHQTPHECLVLTQRRRRSAVFTSVP